MIAKLTSIKGLLIACLLLLCNVLFAQQKTVTGKVTDANSQPVLGATVSVKGTTTGTSTDAQGNFTIAVPNGKNVLLVSNVGYEIREVTLKGDNSVNVSLTPSTTTLNDVLVTGYSSQR